MLGKSQFIFFTCQKLILAHFCKLSYKDRDLWWPNKYRVACFSHFIPAKVKKILRKSQPQIREKLRKLSLRKSVFLIKKRCIYLVELYERSHHFVTVPSGFSLNQRKYISNVIKVLVILKYLSQTNEFVALRRFRIRSSQLTQHFLLRSIV